MPKAATARRPLERQRRERGAAALRSFETIRLLLAEPQTKSGLKEELGCSISSVERLIQDIEGAGLTLDSERSAPKLNAEGAPKYHSESGQYVLYRLLPETLTRRLASRRRRDNDSTTAQLLDMIHLLEGKKHTPGDLAKRLECSRRTVERLFHVLRGAGLTLDSERSGREVYYSLPSETLATMLGQAALKG
jgi:biotin operon repressor